MKRKHLLSLLFAVVLAISLIWLKPFNMNQHSANVLGVAALMVTLWVLEVLAMPVVALLPLILFPLLRICSIEEAAEPYANPIIFLFMGGFLIGLAIEKWGLHKRIALNIVNLTGTSGNRIILGFILSTGFLSMWLSNTATTMMMYPIAMSVITVMEDKHQGQGNIRNLAICLLLSIAYASNFGGIATIIGTPPNVALVAFLEKKYRYTFAFSDWMFLCLPLSLILMFTLYWVMTKWLYRNDLKSNSETSKLIKDGLLDLGKMTSPEKRVLFVFVGTALLWTFRDLINQMQTLIKLDDTIIALIGSVTLFILPGDGKKEHGRQLLQWQDTDRMAWGILLLFGGGISLANQLEKAGLIQLLGNFVAGNAGSNMLLLIFLVTLISVFISEVLSNVAQVIVFAPVVGGIADALGISPLLLGVPLTLGASCAAMMPMGTPPNAIVFASGRLSLKDMVRTGFVMNVISVILITLFCYYLMPLIVS